MSAHKQNRYGNWTRIAAVLTGIAGLAVPAALDASEPVVVGVTAPLSGTFEPFGRQIETAARLAVDAVNAGGGLAGRPLEIIAVDDRCDAEDAVAAANQLVGAGADMVIGPLCFGGARDASRIFAENRIIQISPGTEAVGFSEPRGGAGTFRLAPRVGDQGRKTASFIQQRFPQGRIAIVHDDTAYPKTLAESARTVLEDAGRAVLVEVYQPARGSYEATAERLRDDAASIVYAPGSHLDLAVFARSLRTLLPDATLIGADAIANREFISLAGDAADNAYFPLPRAEAIALDDTGASFAGWPEDAPPLGRYAVATYAALQIYLEAAQAAGGTDYDEVAAILGATTFETLMGPLSFDERGDAESPHYSFFQWRGGTAGPVAD